MYFCKMLSSPKWQRLQEICWDDGCRLGRAYTPGGDAIRFCDNPDCQRWFHAICVEQYQAGPQPPEWPKAISEGLSISKDGHPLLVKLLCSPIQRAPPAFWTGQRSSQFDHPLSFEKAIKAARDGWAEDKKDIGTKEWMKQVLGYQDGEASDAELERRIWQFSQLKIPAYYVCPRCGSVL